MPIVIHAHRRSSIHYSLFIIHGIVTHCMRYMRGQLPRKQYWAWRVSRAGRSISACGLPLHAACSKGFAVVPGVRMAEPVSTHYSRSRDGPQRLCSIRAIRGDDQQDMTMPAGNAFQVMHAFKDEVQGDMSHHHGRLGSTSATQTLCVSEEQPRSRGRHAEAYACKVEPSHSDDVVGMPCSYQ